MSSDTSGTPGEAQHPAIALANTRTLVRGVEHDELADPAAATRWLHARYEEGDLTAAATGRLRELRDSIRALLLARAESTALPGGAVDVVNAALRTAPTVLVLDRADPPARHREPVGTGRLDAVLGGFAEDAVELVTGADAATLAVCGAPDCIRLLVRAHGRRQWCSTRCGDRVRAARHYAKTRPAAR